MHITTTLAASADRYDNLSAIGHEFDNYLARLRNHLDAGTLEATLGLIFSEYRAAIQKQRGLIGLQRLGLRDTSCHMKRLELLEAGAAAVTTARRDARASRGRTDETVVPPGNAVVGFRRSFAMCAKG